jgi:hypothetical protein
MNFAQNGLKGSLSPAVRDLAKLTLFEFYDNRLSGDISAVLDGSLAQLTSLGLELNSYVTGSLPSSIDQLTNLRNLQINDNHITGSIPSSLGLLKNLALLNLEQNYLSGKVPSLPFAQYTGGCSLTFSGEEHNKFSCPLPPGSGQCDVACE